MFGRLGCEFDRSDLEKHESQQSQHHKYYTLYTVLGRRADVLL